METQEIHLNVSQNNHRFEICVERNGIIKVVYVLHFSYDNKSFIENYNKFNILNVLLNRRNNQEQIFYCILDILKSYNIITLSDKEIKFKVKYDNVLEYNTKHNPSKWLEILNDKLKKFNELNITKIIVDNWLFDDDTINRYFNENINQYNDYDCVEWTIRQKLKDYTINIASNIKTNLVIDLLTMMSKNS